MLFHFKGFKRHFAALWIGEFVVSFFWCHEQVSNQELVILILHNFFPHFFSIQSCIFAGKYTRTLELRICTFGIGYWIPWLINNNSQFWIIRRWPYRKLKYTREIAMRIPTIATKAMDRYSQILTISNWFITIVLSCGIFPPGHTTSESVPVSDVQVKLSLFKSYKKMGCYIKKPHKKK